MCGTCNSLILVMILLIISINYNLVYIYSTTFNELRIELLNIENNNIKDLGA